MGKHSKETCRRDSVDNDKLRNMIDDISKETTRIKDKSNKSVDKHESGKYDEHKTVGKRKKSGDKSSESNGHSTLNKRDAKRSSSNKNCDFDGHSVQRSRKERHDSDSDSYSSKYSSKSHKRRSDSQHGKRPQPGNDEHGYDTRKHRRTNDEVYDPNRKIKQEIVTDDESHDVNRSNQNRSSRHSHRNNRDHRNDSTKWGKSNPKEESSKPEEKKEREKPSFALSGKLAEDTNMYNGVVIKYNEPVEAKKPKRKWRFYVFKGEQSMPTLFIHRQSAYLIGRDRRVVDLPVDHPSCSKQHAALQYRLVSYLRDDGSKGKRIRPYIIDLESANGTFVNNQRIDPRRYVELFEKDVLKFGYSSREYVLLHEDSAECEDFDDNLPDEDPNMETEEQDVT